MMTEQQKQQQTAGAARVLVANGKPVEQIIPVGMREGKMAPGYRKLGGRTSGRKWQTRGNGRANVSVLHSSLCMLIRISNERDCSEGTPLFVF